MTGPGAEDKRDAPIGRIGAASRLTDVIAAEPTAIERLAAIDPVFRDLPALSTSASPLGPTLREAAERVGVPVAALLAVITGEAPAACLAADRVEKDCEARPDWLDSFQETAATRIDVRPSLAAGRDPFTCVMAAAAEVPQGGGLVIDALFDPVPLRRVLERRGFATFGRRLAEQHWRICCRRDPGSEAAVHPPQSPSGATVWRSADGVHIDVRGLSPPAPLTAILQLIDSGEHQGIIIVHHQRDALVAGVMGLLLGIRWLIAAAAVTGLAGCGLHIVLMARNLAKRVRRRLGPEFILIRTSWGLLLATLALASALTLDLLPASGPALFSFLLLFGWLLTLLTGVLQRILPFLASMHTARAAGRTAAPTKLTDDRPLAIHRCCHFVAVAMVALGIASGVPGAVLAGAVLGTVGAVAFACFGFTVFSRMRAHLRAPAVTERGRA